MKLINQAMEVNPTRGRIAPRKENQQSDPLCASSIIAETSSHTITIVIHSNILWIVLLLCLALL